jgi:hypothetical protein
MCGVCVACVCGVCVACVWHVSDVCGVCTTVVEHRSLASEGVGLGGGVRGGRLWGWGTKGTCVPDSRLSPCLSWTEKSAVGHVLSTGKYLRRGGPSWCGWWPLCPLGVGRCSVLQCAAGQDAGSLCRHTRPHCQQAAGQAPQEQGGGGGQEAWRGPEASPPVPQQAWPGRRGGRWVLWEGFGGRVRGGVGGGGGMRERPTAHAARFAGW